MTTSPSATVDVTRRNRRAAWLLVVLAPAVAEVGLGNVPLRMAWLFLVFLPIYGAGALFLREILRRATGGYPNLLLLGVVYALVEEGLAVQSLTSSHLYDVAGWSPRLAGVNTAYAELNLVYHPVFSIAIPVILVELIHGRRPYLRRGGTVTAGVVALLGVLLIRVSVPPAQDPGYLMPLAAALLVAAAAILLRRWSADPRWAPRHLLLACLGALAGHTAFGLVVNAATTADRIFLGVLLVATVTLGPRLAPRPDVA